MFAIHHFIRKRCQDFPFSDDNAFVKKIQKGLKRDGSERVQPRGTSGAIRSYCHLLPVYPVFKIGS